MASQWGRNSDIPSGRTPPGSRLLLGMAIGLAIGLGGAYGYLRFGPGDNSAALAAATERARTLESALTAERGLRDTAERERDEARQRLQGIPPADVADPRPLADLEAKVENLGDELDATVERLAAESAARQKAEADAVAAREAAAAAENDGKRLEAEIAAAEQRARDAQERAEAADRLRREAEQRASATVRAESGEVARLQKEIDLLRGTTLAELNARLAEREVLNDRLDKELAESRRAVEQGQAALQAAESEARQAKSALAAEQVRAAELADALRIMRETVPSEPQRAEPPPPAADAASPPTARRATPRDAAEVGRVLAATPGIANLAPERRERLRDDLVGGACVSTALGNAFDRVPVVTLRNLIRDLKSDC